MKKYREQLINLLTVGLILFWLHAAGIKLYDFNEFRIEMRGQIFSATISNILIYVLPIIEVAIAALLVYPATRLLGMILSLALMLSFTLYVGLALLNVYSRMPCNCAGLLGQNASWGANLLLNLFVTAVAAIGLILTFKNKERRKQGMDTIVSHAPLTA